MKYAYITPDGLIALEKEEAELVDAFIDAGFIPAPEPARDKEK